MKLSICWLKDYLELENISTREIANKLTLSGSKVEKIEKKFENIKKIVVGKIVSIEKHPDADKLVICQVLIEDEKTNTKPIQIVTSATNVKQHAIVPVCLHGGSLFDGTKIKAGKLRGVLSQGMLCSLSELGLTKNDFPYADEDGIFLIEEDCKIGENITDALNLNDEILEFEITLNRPDCLSVVGLAREVSANFKIPLKVFAPKINNPVFDLDEKVTIKFQNNLCSRYMAKIVKNVRVGPSEQYIRKRLLASGVKPINNIIDITNFVMLEYGIPMHAFDFKKIKNKKIILRNSKKGETVKTLNGDNIVLEDDSLVVCDDEKIISVAGIIGCENSKIDSTTTEVLFETACFNKTSIRKTSKKLGIRTEASIRFEKDLNPKCCQQTIDRACELVEKLKIGKVLNLTFDVKNFDDNKYLIDFDWKFINRFIGIDLKKDEMANILHSLGFCIENNKIVVPEFRTDIKNKADISEEIARIYGYNRIKSCAIKSFSRMILNEKEQFENLIRQLLTSAGCSEAICYSFLNKQEYLKAGLSDSEFKNTVKILNPIGEETGFLRNSMLPAMLNTLERNYRNKNEAAWLFEIGKIYSLNENLKSKPLEETNVSIGIYGNGATFYSLKGIVETVLDGLNISDCNFEKFDKMPFHPYKSCEIIKDEIKIGIIGQIHPTILENYKINKEIFVSILKFEKLLKLKTTDKTFKQIPKFPPIVRDLSLICEKSVPSKKLEKIIKDSIGNILEEIFVFDVFEGSKLEKNKRSISYKVILRSETKTLKDNDVEKVIDRTLKNLATIGVKIRNF